jgi:F-type H+-transporting ATPase subunit gamma
MATLKQIRQRIKTAKNIRQITRAMKLVAAARLKKAQDRVVASRPYSEKMRVFMAAIASSGQLPALPLLERRPVERYCVILVTAERGLAGSYNTNLIRKAADFVRATPGEARILAVGRKGAQYFAKRGYPVVHQHALPTSGARIEDAVHVTQLARQMFESQEADAIYICYSRFFSAIRQVPAIVELFPIEPPQDDPAAQAMLAHGTEFKFDPGARKLLELLLPKYALTLVLQALLEATASEHGARMTAMTSATDNAGEMISSLTLTANQARQAAITKEILEVVSGAEALSG